MKFTSSPTLNGKVEAPSQSNGASAIAAKSTTFPTRDPQPSPCTITYYLSRYLWAGVPLTRWLLIGLLLLIPLWRIMQWPGGWWVAPPVLLLWAGGLGWLHYWRNRDYIQFLPMTLPTVKPEPLEPQDKIPVYVTGYFTVEEKENRFTWLPGFFRTFATREHALLCQVAPQPRRRIGRWPEEDLGLWYIFFRPEEIQTLAWGTLYFGRIPQSAIAVTYQRTIPKKGWFRPERIVEEVIYIVVETDADGHRLLADLTYDPLAITSDTMHIGDQ